MRIFIFTVLMGMLFLSACQLAVITAVKWDSTATQTRCERVDMRDKAAMDNVFAKYDGWKLVYLSEYTTSNKTGTDAAVCFTK